VYYFSHILKMKYSYSFYEYEHKNFLPGILSCDSHTLGTIYVMAVQEVVGLRAQPPFKNHIVTAW